MGDNKHISQKVKSLYDVLKRNGEDVGSEQEFNDWLLKPGQEGYKNRKYLWDTFNSHGADVGANYEEFAGWLGLRPASQAATSPKTGKQTLVASGAKPLGGGVQSLIESGGVEPASAVSAGTKAAPYGNPMAVDAWLSSVRGQAAHSTRNFNERSANLLEHAKKNPLGRNTVKSGLKYNKNTGDFEQTYVTPYGTRHTDKAEADEVSRQWRDANDHSIEKQIGEAYREQERLEREIEARGKEIEQDMPKPTGLAAFLAGGLDDIKGQKAISAYDYMRADETYNQLVAASNANKERIKTLEAARDKGGFWRGAINTTTDPNTWLFGVPGLVDAVTLYTTSKKLEKNGGDASKLTEAEKSMLDNVIANSNAQGEYGDDLGFMYGAGAVTANALPFVAEFAVTGGFSGLANAGARMGEKLAAKAATKGITGKASQWLIKNTGVAAGDIASSLAMSQTTGAARTASNILGRHMGDATVDESGNYAFRGGENIATAAAKGIVSNTLEYYTEKLGGHLQLGKWLSKGAEKVGLSKLSKAINYASSNKWLEKGGVQDYPSEVLEEEANIVLNALLVGDNKFSDLWDAKTQADIWGGMAFSLGFMNAPKYANTGYQAAQYYRYKHKTDKSDAAASRQIGAEQWQELKEKIDGADNERVSDILNTEIIGNENLSAEGRKAAMYYAKNLLEMRGYNMGLLNSVKDDISDEEEDSNKVVDTSVGSSYSEGYNAEDEAEAATFEMEYAAAKAKADETFDEETLALLDDNPVYTLSALRSSEEFTDEALAIAVDYVNAKAARDGAEQRMADDLDSEIDAARGEVTQRINGDDFMIHGAQMKADNADGTPKRVHIISGNVTMREDGSIDTANSSQTIVVRDAATGKVEMVSPHSIRSVDEAIDPQEEYSNAEAAARAAYEEKKARIQAASEAAAEAEDVADEGNGQQFKGKEEQSEIQQVEYEQGNGQQIKPQTKGENLQTETQAGAESPIVEQTEIPVEKDKKGNVVRTLYHKVPMQRTLEDLYDGSLDQEEIDRFVENLAADAKRRLASVENEKKPQIGSNKRAYLEEKRRYEEKLADARAEVEYYDNLQKEVLRVTQRSGQQTGVAEDLGGEPLSLEELAARFASEYKVTPESLKGETGMSGKELKGFVGLVAKEENGGVSIERLGELLARSDEWAQLGGTPEMTQEARNMLIDAYMSGNPRSYVKQQRKRFAQREAEHEMNEIENFAQAAFGMSAEEYLAYEEQALPAIINKYAGFDFDIYYAILQEQADARESEAEANNNNSINGNTNEQQGESNGNGGRGGILQTEGTADEQGERTSDEQETGGQGSVGNAGLQGVGTQRNVGEGERANTDDRRGGNGSLAGREQGGLAQEEINYQLSDEVDENGRQFVLNSDGEIEFGRIGEDTGLTPAPILLSEGIITNQKTNAGYGLLHIEARHGNQIRAAGYGSVLEFIEEVAKNYEVIRKGNDRDGRKTYMLQLTDKHNNTLIVELSGSGTYWNINTAGIFKTSYGANRDVVYDRHTTDNQPAETDGASLSGEQSDTTPSTSMNAPAQSYKNGALDNTTDTGKTHKGNGNDTATPENTVVSVGKVTEKENSVQTSIANAEQETDTNPSEAQKKAGNYKKGHVKIDGFDVTIENPKGSMRRGTDVDGKQWEQEMHNTYGYILGTEGVDGDHIDVFLSDNPANGDVFVVDQVNKDGTFDEHKVMYGFASEEEARNAYLSNYEDGWTGLGAITRVSKEEFKKWVDSSHRKTKPFAEYKGVKKTEATDNAEASNSTRSAFDNLKKQASDRMLIFKEGGNYEILYEDAKKAAEILGLPVQKKDGKTFVSFPIKDLDKNLPLLIRGGVMVAITDELVKTKNQKAEKAEVPGMTEVPGSDAGKTAVSVIGSMLSEEESARLSELREKDRKSLEKRELEEMLTLERKDRILREGTYYDKPFGLKPAGEISSAEDIEENIAKIIKGLKTNEGDGRFKDFEGFAYGGNYAKNAGRQIDEYLQALIDVIPFDITKAWCESHGLETHDDVYSYGERLYNAEKTEGQNGETHGKTDSQGNPLSAEVVSAVIDAMKAQATVAPTIEITDDSWKDSIKTPIGNVKMGAHQKEKLFTKGRGQQYGMLVETLSNPDIVLEEMDKTENLFHERPSSYLFVKTFQKEDGSKYIHFESVTVSQEGMEVSVSSHIIRENQLKNKLKSDRLLYKATALDAPAITSAEQPIKGGSLSSEGKVRNNPVISQRNGVRNGGVDELVSDATSIDVEDVASFPNEIREEDVISKEQNGGKRRNGIKVKAGLSGNDLYIQYREGRSSNDKRYWATIKIPNATNHSAGQIIYRLGYLGTFTDIERLAGDAVLELFNKNGLRLQKGEAKEVSSREAAMRDALVDVMRGAGVEVIEDAEEGQRVLDAANRGMRLQAKKRALETASLSEDAERSLTVVSSADGAKVLNNLDNLTALLENSATQPKTFVGSVAKELGAQRYNSKSEYATFETKSGRVVTIRLADHNATVSNFDQRGELDGISIVISPKPNQGIINDGNAHIVEYYYDAIKLRRADGKPLADIVRSIKQALYSGEFKDATGIAEVQEVNIPNVRVKLNKRSSTEAERIEKETQLDIINKTNPAPDDYHTWVRTTDDILTLQEAVDEVLREDPSYELSSYPDVSDDVIRDALKTGKITVYSSYPIANGVFVTPSMMQAADYAGGMKVYSKVVSISDVAWLSTDEGQYATTKEDAGSEENEIRFFRTPDGHAYGFTMGGKIYIDARIAGADTPIHEYTHLWAEALRKANPKEWENIVGLMKGSPLWEEVKKKYPDLKTDSEIADEVLAHYSGKRGAERLRKAQEEALKNGNGILEKTAAVASINNVRTALKRFWKGVADFFGVHFNSAEEVADKVLSDMLNGVKPEVTGKTDTALAKEEAEIIAKAKADDTYLKAPNGKPTNLTPRQWVQVRTKAFKKWFGDWEKRARIEKLRKSESASITGEEIEITDDYKQNKKNALEYGKRLQGEYTNADTGVSVQLQRGRHNGGIKEVLQHNYKDAAHILSVAAIPQIIEKSVYIESEANNDTAKNPDVVEYQHFVCGLKIGNEDYTVHSLVAVDKHGNRYYDHNLTHIEKTKLLDSIERQAVKGQGFDTTSSTELTTLNGYKGKKLLELLQTNSSKVVDENGEPMVVYHGRSSNFNSFEKQKGSRFVVGVEIDSMAEGFFFTPNKDFAERFSYNSQDLRGGKANVLSCFLNVRTPLDLISDDFENRYEQATGWEYNIYMDSIDNLWEMMDVEGVSNILKSKGYDGVLFAEKVNEDRKVEEISICVLSPTQIKSATDNVGTFDGSNPDIRYQFVGENGAENAAETDIPGTEELARDGRGAYTDDKVSMENDPWSKMAGYNIRSKKERMAFAERERRRMVAAVTELAERLGIADDVEIVTDLSGLQGRQRRAKGIYRKSSGKITIYIPNHINVADAVATFLHEAVAHKGLRNLFGKHFDEFLDKVYANSNSEIRSAIDALAKKKKFSTRTATEEYLAGLAESTDFEHLPYDGWWQRVKEFFIDMLHKAGIKALDMTTLTDNELRYILWRSYRYMQGKDKGIIAFVEDTAMKMKLGVGYSEKEGASGAAEVAGKTEVSAKNKKNSARSVFDNLKKQQAFDKVFLFKVGDNYEILYEDAKSASEILGLPLQEKDGKEFVSFPVKDLDKNLALLVRGGAYVAVDNNPVQELFRDGETEVPGETDNSGSIENVNKRFNERLSELVANPNQKDRVLHLGNASGFLRAGGLLDAEILLEFDKLLRKSRSNYKNNHPFDISDANNLPLAIHNPIAIFDNTNGEDGGRVILTELKKNGRNFIVVVQAKEQRRKGGVLLEINEISTLYPKEAKGVIKWLIDGNATNIDKNKALRFIEELQPLAGTTIKSEELVSAAKIVENFESPKIEGENSEEELFRDGEEGVSDDTENADETDGGKKKSDTKALRDILMFGNLSLTERTTAAKLLYSNIQNWDKKRKADAVKAIGENIADLAKVMRLQRDFDKATVKRVHDLARVLMESGYLSGMTEQEVKRLLATVKNSVGKNDIDASVQKVMDIMIDNMLRRGKAALSAIESVRGSKTDTRGVEVQGMLGVDGQTIVKAFKEAKKIVNPCAGKTEGENGENTAWGAAFESVYSRMDSKDQAVADEASLEYAGMQMAQQWYDEIAKSKLEEEVIRLELKEEHDKKSAEERRTDSYREFAASMEEAIRQNKIERAQAYFNLAGRLSDSLRGSVENALAFKEAEKQRIGEIHHAANSDMQGRSAKEHQMPAGVRKWLNNILGSSLFAPYGTFMEMLKLFGRKSANGEGYLFDRFGRGWIDARQKEIVGVRKKLDMLDAKAKEVFGGKVKKWGDLIRAVGKLPKGKVSFYNGGEIQDMELPQGNLMYIYMANKMLDGKMKLRKMGISEEDVSRIEEFLDPRLKEIADWLQGEFLVKTRNEYNKTHKRMFGASMAAIENYFPLRILENALDTKADELDRPAVTDGISTLTGSIIKRRRNSKPLDILNADALHVILSHISQMEHWNAFAEFNRDLNTLRSYKRFRNQVLNMETIYGNGDKLWKRFNDLCQIATGVYDPKGDGFGKALLSVAQGATAAAISFRLYTALKQFASIPAYIAYVRMDDMAKAMMRPDKSWEWCMEHLPIFEERWKSRVGGDPRLVKSFLTAADWRRNLAANLARAGMAPNAFIDALTCSMGSYATYQTRKRQYLKDGYSEDQAERRAIQDAEFVYNETQQSSEGAFVSVMQTDKTYASVLFSVFRNASMAYQRQLHGALRDLGNASRGGINERVEFMTKQLLREKGIEKNADGEWDYFDYKREEAIVKRKVRRGLTKDALSVAVFGYIMQLAWNISGYLPYLLFGDDDETKGEFWEDIWTHTMGGWLEGMAGGDLMSLGVGMLLSGNAETWKLKKEMPITKQLKDTFYSLFSGDFGAFATNATNLLIQVSAGVNPQSLTDGALAILDACGGDVSLANEAVLCATRILSVPQSQIKELYFDEVGLSGEEASKLTPAQLAERYAIQKVKRGHFFSPWTWDDEERIEKYTKEANESIRKRFNRTESKEIDEAYERYNLIAEEVDKKEKDLDKAYEDGDISKEDAEKREAEIKADKAYNTYALFKQYDTGLNEIIKAYIRSKTPEAAAVCREAIEEYKSKMVDVLSAENYEDILKRRKYADDYYWTFVEKYRAANGEE